VVRFLPFLISLVLSVYALFSCIQTPDEDVPHLPKLVWIVLIVFVPFVGPIVWLLMSRTQPGPTGGAVRRSPSPGSRPVAPDDDPDFLKSLDRYRDPRTTKPEPTKPEPPKPEPTKREPTGDGPKDAKKKPQDKPKKSPKPTEETPSETDDGKA
jgi:outer membrane biosynthesis protein TonB